MMLSGEKKAIRLIRVFNQLHSSSTLDDFNEAYLKSLRQRQYIICNETAKLEISIFAL
jgi:hypothetical protein